MAERAKCPYCGGRVALSKKGDFKRHNARGSTASPTKSQTSASVGGVTCLGSGKREAGK